MGEILSSLSYDVPAFPMEKTPMKRHAGFTLVEILVAIVIVAILAAIAYPVYIHYVEASRRTSAITALQRAAAAEEKYYATYNVYATSLKSMDYDSNSVAIPSSTEHWYTLAASSDSSGYALQAAPYGHQAGDACGTFILTATGAKSLSGNSKTVEQCWGQ